MLLAEKFANDFHFGEPGNLGCKSYRTTEGKALGLHTFATEFPLNKFQATALNVKEQIKEEGFAHWHRNKLVHFYLGCG